MRRTGSSAAGGERAALDQRPVRIAAKSEHSVALEFVALDVDVVDKSCTPSVGRGFPTLRPLLPFSCHVVGPANALLEVQSTDTVERYSKKTSIFGCRFV